MSNHQVSIFGSAQMPCTPREQLHKVEVHAPAAGYVPCHLLSARLAPDMHPYASQIQFFCTQAREVVRRLTYLCRLYIPLGKADHVPHMSA